MADIKVQSEKEVIVWIHSKMYIEKITTKAIRSSPSLRFKG